MRTTSKCATTLPSASTNSIEVLATLKWVESSYQEFPNADTITRRLKKLIQTIVRGPFNIQKLNFTSPVSAIEEPTGWTLEEKKHILKLVTDFGVPSTSEGKNDWAQLRDKLQAQMLAKGTKLREGEGGKNAEERGVQQLERFVQRLRVYSQQILEDPASVPPIFGPDNDGFTISAAEAQSLYKNINMLIFIRKHILATNGKIFTNGISLLSDNLAKHRLTKHSYLPSSWDVALHDKHTPIS
jgi:hypothetical protein